MCTTFTPAPLKIVGATASSLHDTLYSKSDDPLFEYVFEYRPIDSVT